MGLLLKFAVWLVYRAVRLLFVLALVGAVVSYVGYRITRSGGGQPARSAAAPSGDGPESADAAESAPEASQAGDGSAAAGGFSDGVVAPREGWSVADYSPAIRNAGAYSPEGRELQAEQGLLVQRERWDRHIERLASGGATDEEVALARDAAERNLAEMARQGELRVKRARHGRSWSPPPPDPVEQKRASIERSRQKREASWDRWIERKEASGMPADRLAEEIAWVERRKAEDRDREDRELAELEERMRRRAAGGAPAAEGPGYNP